MSADSTKATVNTKDQLIWALANADEIIVEGDEELRRYAERIVDGSSPSLDITGGHQTGVAAPDKIEVTGPITIKGVTTGSDILIDVAPAPEPPPPPPSVHRRAERLEATRYREAESMASAPRQSSLRFQKRRSGRTGILIGAIVAFVVIAGSSAWWSLESHAPRSPNILDPGQGVGPGGPRLPAPTFRSRSPTPPQSPGPDLVQLAWVAVALAAIFAVYRVVSKAIDGDRNVELAWKVTQKVSGKLVIKKVPVAQPRPRANRRAGAQS